MFIFTPLLGSQSQSPATQTILEFDGGVKILVDVGWDDSFDADLLVELERQVPTISVILLTHATLSHLGAFAHCCKHIPRFSRIPVYATLPVITLGRTLLQDLYASTPLAASTLPPSALPDPAYSLSVSPDSDSSKILLQPPSNDEIAAYFRDIHQLKYSQAHQPLAAPSLPPLEGLTITAFAAGHSLGGTIWHLQHGSESVVYAVDWNQARENVLSSAAWLSTGSTAGTEVIEQLRQPTALICSSRGAERTPLSGGWKKRDELLIEALRSTINNGGTALIPCDSSARVLEMIYVLEHAWREDRSESASLRRASLYMAGRTYSATVQNTKRMLEWMNEGIVREFEAAANATQQNQGVQRAGASSPDKVPSHPFEFSFLKVLERHSQLDRAMAAAGPKVIIASDTCLNWGFSKTLLQHINSDDRNLVVLTNIDALATSTTTARTQGICSSLCEIWKAKTGHDPFRNPESVDVPTIVSCEGRKVKVLQWQVSALVGKELSIYQQYLAGQKQRFNTANVDQTSKVESAADAADDEASSSSDSTADSDTEHQGRALNLSATMDYSRHKLGLTDEELGINILLRKRGIHDYDVRGKRGRERMFPYVAKRRRVDDFGDLIRSDEYLRAEEREENETEETHGQGGNKNDSVGQKRRWDDKFSGRNIRNKDGKLQNEGNRSKKRTTNGQQEAAGGGDESDESDYEPAEATIQGPTKATFTIEEIQLKMKLCFVDYSGLYDKRSLQMLLPLIKPRKLIFTSGNSEETTALAADCRKLLHSNSHEADTSATADVFTPAMRESVDASVDTNAWTIRLSQSLISRLHWQNVRGLGVVTLTGRVKAPEKQVNNEDSANKKQKLNEAAEPETNDRDMQNASKEDNAFTPVLDVLPASMASAARSFAQPLHVGDLRLADLRKLMQASGHTAEFKGEGTLLVDGIIAVRKSGVGKIEVESGASVGMTGSFGQQGGSFYNVKKRIYESLAVVAAR